MLYCPNCNGTYYINQNNEITVTDVIVSDKEGFIYDKGKVGVIPDGSKSLIGKLSDILFDPDDTESDDYFSIALKVVIKGKDYRIKQVKRFGLLDDHLFEAIAVLSEPLETNLGALTS